MRSVWNKRTTGTAEMHGATVNFMAEEFNIVAMAEERVRLMPTTSRFG